MKQLYIFSISIMLASHTLRSAESDQLSTSPRYQALLPTPLTESPQTRCCSSDTRFKVCYCTGMLAGAAILGAVGHNIYPITTPRVCADYSVAFAYKCYNNCSMDPWGQKQGFWLSPMCPLASSAYQNTLTQLKALCLGNTSPAIKSIRICSHTPQPPCKAWEPALQKFNKSCSQPTSPQIQPTLEEIRQKHRANLTAMAARRKPGASPLHRLRG